MKGKTERYLLGQNAHAILFRLQDDTHTKQQQQLNGKKMMKKWGGKLRGVTVLG